MFSQKNRSYFCPVPGKEDIWRAERDMIMIKHGRVIPPTGPLTLIHLSSVCFDSKAATQINVCLYCDSISRGGVIFPSLRSTAFVVSTNWDQQPSNQRGPSQLDTTDDLLVGGQDPRDEELNKIQNNQDRYFLISLERSIFCLLDATVQVRSRPMM